MLKNNTNHGEKQATTKAASLLAAVRSERRRSGRRLGVAAELLRADRGAATRIARRLGVNRSTVSRVINGKKTSERVRLAIIRECVRMARMYTGAGALIEVEADVQR